ncbi:MAG: hypothetical protein ABIH20_06085 [Candidatus Diapherotrites archaeon]
MGALKRRFGRRFDLKNPESGRHIHVSQDFERFTSGTRFIRHFLEAKKQIGYGPKKRKTTVNGVTVTLLPRGEFANFAYKVEVLGRVFFVKEQVMGKVRGEAYRPEYDLATPQALALQKARRLLPKKRYPNLEIAVPHIAWTKKGTSFLVTDFYNGTLLEKTPKGKIPKNIYSQFIKASKEMDSRGFRDFGDNNAIWCPEEQKIVVFDIYQAKS